MRTTTRALAVTFTLTGLLFSSLSHAQVAPAAPASGKSPTAPRTDEETIVISPFVVSTEKDNGYIAADTLSSGRMSTNLLMTPSDVTVLTRDFLNDIGAFNIDEASSWLTNSRPIELGAVEGNSTNAATMDVRDGGSNVTLRGLATQPSTRNYFVSGTTPMEYNVERVEGARGPNAILYGEGGQGGQVNYLTKKARTRNFVTTRLRADSWGSKGISVDVNRTLTRKAALRYNGSWLDNRGWQDRVKTSSAASALSLVYRPFDRTSVSVDVDTSHTFRSGLINDYIDTQSNWNRTPVTGRGTLTAAQATAAGLAILGTGFTQYRVYTDGLGILNWQGFAQTTGGNVPIVPTMDRGIARMPLLPRKEFNSNPSEVNVTARTTDVQTAIQHIFSSDLVVELAGAYSRINQNGASVRYDTAYADPNTVLPDGRPNPNFGKTYSGTFYGRNVDGSSRDMKALRLASNYPIKIFRGVQNFSVIGQHQETNARTLLSMQRIVDNPSAANPITSNNNLLYVFRYWDNLPSRLPDFSNTFQFRNVPESENTTQRKSDAVQLGTYGSYLDNRLSIVGGFRRDKSTLITRDAVITSRDPVTGAFGAYTPGNRVAYNNSFSGGVVYFPFKKYVGVYADYSEGFLIQTNSNPRIDGSFSDVNIVPSSSKSAGARFSLLEGKLVGSAGYYESKQSNGLLTVGVSNINTLWTNHDQPEKQVKNFGSGSSQNITDSQSLEGRGWEIETTANIGNALRLTGNLAFPQTKQTDVGAGYRGYVAANLATWQAWANDPTNPTRANDLLQVNNILGAITSFQDGRVQNQTYKYRANVFGNYIVRSTPLKGLRVGLGAQFYGPRLIGNDIGLPYSYVYDRSYHTFAGSLGYPAKFKKFNLDVQLNVANLLDYDKPLFGGLLILNGANIPYAFKYPQPRVIRLTTTLTF